MLVVFPPSIRHDDGITPSYYEDHLLERVSLLELRLAQVMGQLTMVYEFIRSEIKSFQKDHTLLESFFETIERVNPDLSNLLSENCLEIFDEKKEKLAFENKQEQILSEIIINHNHNQTELFTHLVKESQKSLEKNEEKQAFSMLDRAILLSPQNVPLLVFTAEHFFRTEKFDPARINLEKAFEIAPHNEKVLLLLGAIYADQAKSESARQLLSVLINKPEKNVCLNYIWGMLAAFEGNWTESIAAFKQSLQIGETAEIHYLIGCVFFQLNRFEAALAHLQSAILLDTKFADAWFMQSLIYQISNNKEAAKNAMNEALQSKETGAQSLEYLNRKKIPDLEIALPFLHFSQKEKQLLTKGSRRLSKFFREKIFKALE